MQQDVEKTHHNPRITDNEYLLKNLTDHLPVALYQFLTSPNGDLTFLYVSRAVTDIFKVTPEELLLDNTALIKTVHPDDIGPLIETIDTATRRMQIWDCQFRVVLPNHEIRWIRDVSRPEKLEDGSVLSHGYWEDITEQKKTNDWIRYLNTALMNISESIIITNMGSKIIYANQKVKELHGYEPEEIIGKPADMMNVDPMSEAELTELSRTLSTGGTYTGTALSRRKDGSTFLCEFSLSPIEGDDQATCIGVQRDVTERTQIMNALEESRERYKTTLFSVGEGILSTDYDGFITVMNPLAEKMTGWSEDEAAGKSFAEICTVVNERTGIVCENPVKIVVDTAAAYQPDFPTVLVSKTGEEIPVEIIAAPIKSSGDEIAGVVIVLKDFSEYRERQKQIEFLSYHDFLTGLYNRRYLEMEMKTVDTRENMPLTVMTLDVNGLKLTNDAFGHAMGDRLLRSVADILRDACRADDLIARIGGDEFAILLPRTNEEKAEAIRKRILKAAMKTKLENVVVSLSIGFSVKVSPKESLDAVFQTRTSICTKKSSVREKPCATRPSIKCSKISMQNLNRSKSIPNAYRNIAI
jgi:diguanylate cyclase (GGDEF)-like protein/PAS domain S-box-containing protein